ncbi:hypothetical protein G6F63_014477 [Rhizopus arrhizus]|nr:hypothetical protein G6F63_014477 [Rhizopus arrhizus]
MRDAVAVNESRQRAIGKIAGAVCVTADRCSPPQRIRGIADDASARVSVAGQRAVGIVAVRQTQVAQIRMLQRLAAEQASAIVLIAVDDHRPGRVVLRTDFRGQGIRRLRTTTRPLAKASLR